MLISEWNYANFQVFFMFDISTTICNSLTYSLSLTPCRRVLYGVVSIYVYSKYYVLRTLEKKKQEDNHWKLYSNGTSTAAKEESEAATSAVKRGSELSCNYFRFFSLFFSIISSSHIRDFSSLVSGCIESLLRGDFLKQSTTIMHAHKHSGYEKLTAPPHPLNTLSSLPLQ